MDETAGVALVTGGARRIGASVVEALHADGWRVIVHCRHSREDADALAARLNESRPDSVRVVVADLLKQVEIEQLARTALAAFRRLDLLVNNASSFYPTSVRDTTREQWNDIVGSNLTAPFFLCQALASALARNNGAIVNLVDIHASRPLAGHAVYSTAKAGLHMLTRALAQELAPSVRVNGVAPGAILWPQGGVSKAERQRILDSTPLQRMGQPRDIADAVLFLARSPFITGQVIAVDGGRSL